MLDEFENWLIKCKNVSAVSAHKYSSAISVISAEMVERGVVSTALVGKDIDPNTVSMLIEQITANSFFREKNSRGNNMYSVALNHYLQFVQTRTFNTNNTVDATTRPHFDMSSLRKEYIDYLTRLHPEWTPRTVDAYASDAFFAYNNDLTDKFWTLLSDDIGLDECFLLIFDFLSRTISKEKALSRAKHYHACMVLLSQYLISAYGGMPMFASVDGVQGEKAIEGCERESEINIYMKNTDMKYSYKPVLMLAILSSINKKNISIDYIISFFERFYKQREKLGFSVERDDSVFSRKGHSYNQAAKTIVSGPIQALEKADLIHYCAANRTLSVDQRLIVDLEGHGVLIAQTCNNRLTQYFNKMESESFQRGRVNPTWIRGKKVVHEQYGKGQIVLFSDGALTVRFEDGITRKIPTTSILLKLITLCADE